MLHDHDGEPSTRGDRRARYPGNDARVCYAPGDYRLETVAVPLPGPLKV